MLQGEIKALTGFQLKPCLCLPVGTLQRKRRRKHQPARSSGSQDTAGNIRQNRHDQTVLRPGPAAQLKTKRKQQRSKYNKTNSLPPRD